MSLWCCLIVTCCIFIWFLCLSIARSYVPRLFEIRCDDNDGKNGDYDGGGGDGNNI